MDGFGMGRQAFVGMVFSIISEYVYCVFCNRSGCILVILAACNESTGHITYFLVYPISRPGEKPVKKVQESRKPFLPSLNSANTY